MVTGRAWFFTTSLTSASLSPLNEGNTRQRVYSLAPRLQRVKHKLRRESKDKAELEAGEVMVSATVNRDQQVDGFEFHGQEFCVTQEIPWRAVADRIRARSRPKGLIWE